jgi:hypothetical protein
MQIIVIGKSTQTRCGPGSRGLVPRLSAIFPAAVRIEGPGWPRQGSSAGDADQEQRLDVNRKGSELEPGLGLAWA